MSTPGPNEKPASPVLRRVLYRFRREDDHSSPTKPAALSLRLGMHRLWTDHVIWTREYVVAAIAGTPMPTRSPAGCKGEFGRAGTARLLGAVGQGLAPITVLP